MIIYIVRHGQTAENLQMILQGTLPLVALESCFFAYK